LVDNKEECERLHDNLVARLASQRKKKINQADSTESTESDEESDSDAIQIED